MDFSYIGYIYLINIAYTSDIMSQKDGLAEIRRRKSSRAFQFVEDSDSEQRGRRVSGIGSARSFPIISVEPSFCYRCFWNGYACDEEKGETKLLSSTLRYEEETKETSNKVVGHVRGSSRETVLRPVLVNFQKKSITVTVLSSPLVVWCGAMGNVAW